MRMVLLLVVLAACGWALTSRTPDRDAGAEGEAPRGIDWSQSRTLSPSELDPRFVQCTLSGGNAFMDRSDCLARGGPPRDV